MTPFRVNGQSMWPVLQTGDLVFATPSHLIRVGDLVIRNIHDDVVLHRYLSSGFTKGDRFTVADQGRITEALVVRRVVPGRFAKQSGEISSARADSVALRFLSRVQASLSDKQRQLGRLARCLTPLLMANGWLLRACYFATLEGRLDDALPRNKRSTQST